MGKTFETEIIESMRKGGAVDAKPGHLLKNLERAQRKIKETEKKEKR